MLRGVSVLLALLNAMRSHSGLCKPFHPLRLGGRLEGDVSHDVFASASGPVSRKDGEVALRQRVLSSCTHQNSWKQATAFGFT